MQMAQGRSKSSSSLDQQSTGEQRLSSSDLPHLQKGVGSSSTGHRLSSAGSFNDHDGHKKSVLLKVKEKAKKWKQVLGKKRQARQDGAPRVPSFGSTSIDSNRGGGGAAAGEGGGGEEEENPPPPAPGDASNVPSGAQKGATSGKDSTMQSPARSGNANKQAEMVKATQVDKHPASEMNRPDPVKEITIQEIPAAANIITVSDRSIAVDPTNNDAKNNKNNKNKNDDDKNTSNTTTNKNTSNTTTNKNTSNTTTNNNNSNKNNNENNNSNNNNSSSSSSNNNNKANTRSSSSKFLLGPAYTMTQAIATKIQESSGPMYEIAAKQVWDKSLSMKEYLLQKLEPREEDKALCKVITEVVRPRLIGSSSAEVEAANTKNDSAGKVTPTPISTKSHSAT